MIVLIDNLDQKKVGSKSTTKSRAKPKTQENALRQLRQALANAWARHQKRKVDKIALRQLMQLDDALLKDMGLSRYDLMSVSSGHLTFDALVKQKIVSNRDNACSTTTMLK